MLTTSPSLVLITWLSTNANALLQRHNQLLVETRQLPIQTIIPAQLQLLFLHGIRVKLQLPSHHGTLVRRHLQDHQLLAAQFQLRLEHLAWKVGLSGSTNILQTLVMATLKLLLQNRDKNYVLEEEW